MLPLLLFLFSFLPSSSFCAPHAIEWCRHLNKKPGVSLGVLVSFPSHPLYCLHCYWISLHSSQTLTPLLLHRHVFQDHSSESGFDLFTQQVSVELLLCAQP